MRSNRTTRRGGGFTLVEVLAVLVLAAALLAVGGKVYVGALRGRLLDKAAADLVYAARYARMLAIERQESCELVLDKAGGRFCVSVSAYDEAAGRWERQAVVNQFTRPVELEGEIHFGAVLVEPRQQRARQQQGGLGKADEKVVVFTPAGTADTAVIALTDEQAVRTVAISRVSGQAVLVQGDEQPLADEVLDLDGL